MILLFDTETTGLPKNWKAPVTDLDNWPRLVQLAYLVYDFDGNLIHSCNEIIKPNGFTIPTDASKVHGISTEMAYQRGLQIDDVFEIFLIHLKRAQFIVAHNMAYDEKIIGSELIRLGFDNVLEKKERICTMLETVELCKIKGPYGFKWPKLEELHYQLFNFYFEGAHDALADIQATAKCFWELKKIGVLKLNSNKSKDEQPILYKKFDFLVNSFPIVNDESEFKNDILIPIITGNFFSPSCWSLYNLSEKIIIGRFESFDLLNKFCVEKKLPKYNFTEDLDKWENWNFKNNELRFNGEIILNLSNVIESRSSTIHDFVDFSMCKVNDYLAAIGEVIVIAPDDWDDPPAYYIFSQLIFLDKNGNLYWDGN